MRFIRDSKLRWFESPFENAYVDLKLDLDKLEEYADKAADQFKKDTEEKGERYAILNQFSEVKPKRPFQGGNNHMKKAFSHQDKY